MANQSGGRIRWRQIADYAKGRPARIFVRRNSKRANKLSKELSSERILQCIRGGNLRQTTLRTLRKEAVHILKAKACAISRGVNRRNCRQGCKPGKTVLEGAIEEARGIFPRVEENKIRLG